MEESETIWDKARRLACFILGSLATYKYQFLKNEIQSIIYVTIFLNDSTICFILKRLNL